jgi:hypothetical protein
MRLRLGGDSQQRRGPPGRGRQRFALLVSATTLIAALLIVLALSPREPPARPPRDLLGYGESGVLAVVRLQRVAEIWKELRASRFFAEARARGLGDLEAWMERSLLPYLPAELRALSPFASSLLDLDLVVFLYSGEKGLELGAVGRGSAPVDFRALSEGGEKYRGHELYSAGQLHLTWRGPWVLLASTRPRLKRLLDRHLGARGLSLADDPSYRRAMEGLSVSDRALLYLNLERGLTLEPWRSLVPSLPRKWWGEAKAFALTIDPRPRGARVTASLVHGAAPQWAAEAGAWLGSPRLLGARAVAPRDAVWFAGASLADAPLRKHLSENDGAVPEWMAPLLSLVEGALGKKRLAQLLEKPPIEAAMGMVPASPLPSLFGAVRVQEPTSAQPALRVLADYLPGALGDALNPVSRRRERTVDGVALFTRELDASSGVGYGLHRDWLFGGGITAAERVAKAIGGRPWQPSPLAAEIFTQPAALLGWIDLRATSETVRRGSATNPRLRQVLERLGRLPEALLEAGVTATFEPDRVVGRAFVGFRDFGAR